MSNARWIKDYFLSSFASRMVAKQRYFLAYFPKRANIHFRENVNFMLPDGRSDKRSRFSLRPVGAFLLYMQIILWYSWNADSRGEWDSRVWKIIITIKNAQSTSFRNSVILFELLAANFEEIFCANVPFTCYKSRIFCLRIEEKSPFIERDEYVQWCESAICLWKFVARSRIWKIDLFIRISTQERIICIEAITEKYKLNKQKDLCISRTQSISYNIKY